MARDLPLVRARHLGHLDELGVERADAGKRAEIDDEEHRDGDQRDLRLDADAEPQDEQRRERELGRAVAADHERIEDRGRDRKPAQRERQRRGRDCADQESGHRLDRRIGGVAQEIAADDAAARIGQATPQGEPIQYVPRSQLSACQIAIRTRRTRIWSLRARTSAIDRPPDLSAPTEDRSRSAMAMSPPDRPRAKRDPHGGADAL